MRNHPSALTWHALAAGDLPVWRHISVLSHTAWCARCGRERRAILAERLAWTAPPLDLPLKAARLVASPQRRTWRWDWRLALCAPALATCLLLAVRPTTGPTLRGKGGDVFALFVHHGDETGPLRDACRPGDQLRARYASDLPYLMVLGGAVGEAPELLFPTDGAESARIAAKTPQLTPGSWILDGRAGEEQFIAIFSSVPLQAKAAQERVMRGENISGGAPTDAAAIEGTVRTTTVRCRKVIP